MYDLSPKDLDVQEIELAVFSLIAFYKLGIWSLVA